MGEVVFLSSKTDISTIKSPEVINKVSKKNLEQVSTNFCNYLSFCLKSFSIKGAYVFYVSVIKNMLPLIVSLIRDFLIIILFVAFQIFSYQTMMRFLPS